MPIQIKAVVAALILSCVSSLMALYFHEIEGSGFGYSDTWSLVFRLIWVGIIIWLVWDLVKNRRDIRLTLGIVAVIMFAGTALNLLDLALLDSKLRYAMLFDAAELVLWLFAFILLSLGPSKEWYSSHRQT